MKNLSLRANFIALARKDAAYLGGRIPRDAEVGSPLTTIVTESQLLLLTAAENLIDCVDNPNSQSDQAIRDERVAIEQYALARAATGGA